VRDRLIPWAVALLALLPHLAGLRNGFVYDDFRFFVENPGVRSLERPWELVTDVGRASIPQDRDIWRPLRTLAFAGEHALFGNAAAGWHAVSLLVHLLLVRGLIALASRLPEMTRGRALAAGLLFGVHPLTVESVAWISSQGDLLAALFVVLSLVSASRRPIVAAIAATLALLGKESALPLFVVLAAARRGLPEPARPRRAVVAAATALTVVYVAVRQALLARGFDLTAAGFSQTDAGIGARLLQVAQNVPLTLRLFVWPWPLSVDYDHNLVGRPGVADVVVAVALLGVIGWALARWRNLRARAGFALLFAVLSFVPTCGIVALKSPTAERFLLLPCAGLALALMAAFAAPTAGAWRRQARVVVLAGVALVLASVTFQRTRDFESDEALWRAELSIHPTSLQARLGLLHAASERRDLAAESELAESIVELAAPGDARRVAALFALGQLAFDAGDEERGAARMEQCRREIVLRGRVDDLDPALLLAWVALGNFHRSRFGAADAEVVLRDGIERFGRRPRLLEGLGVAREEQNDAAGAEALYREALAAGEESASLRHHLARALVHLGRVAEARKEVEQALTLEPSHVPSRLLLDELSR